MIKKAAEGIELVQQGTAPQPSNGWMPHDQFDIGPAFKQQRRGLDGALSAAHDDHPPACKTIELIMLRRMGGDRMRHCVEGGWTLSKWSNAGCNHNALRFDSLAACQYQSESGRSPLQPLNTARIQIRDSLALKPPPIRNKIPKRNRPRQTDITGFLIFVERQGVVRIRDM